MGVEASVNIHFYASQTKQELFFIICIDLRQMSVFDQYLLIV